MIAPHLGSRFAATFPELSVPYRPAPCAAPRLVQLNEPLARELGLEPDELRSDAGIAFLTGAGLPPGSHPVAQGYAGHQFGAFSPRLGDGRAVLLGELTPPHPWGVDVSPRAGTSPRRSGRTEAARTAQPGQLMGSHGGDTDGDRHPHPYGSVDLHLKGSGRTPFSRGGDGLAALGPMLREYLISEALHHLGVPTTRCLAVLTTGSTVRRTGVHPGAILVRVAASHLRIGSVQYARLLVENDLAPRDLLDRLVLEALARHYPDVLGVSRDGAGAERGDGAHPGSAPNPGLGGQSESARGTTSTARPGALPLRSSEPSPSSASSGIGRHRPLCTPELAEEFLRRVSQAQAATVAAWMRYGFVHGVMNTDNAALSGETIDFGPCAFMERFDPATCFSSIDSHGRYSYGNQPSMALWNLTRLAEAMLPLFGDGSAAVDRAEAVLQEFPTTYRQHWQAQMARALGVEHSRQAGAVVDGAEALLGEARLDLTTFLRDPEAALADHPAGTSSAPAGTEDHPSSPDPRAAGDAARSESASASHAQQWLQLWKSCRPDVEARRSSNPLYIPRNHVVDAALQAAEAGDYAPFERILGAVRDPFTPRPGVEDLAVPAPEDAPAFVTYCGT